MNPAGNPVRLDEGVEYVMTYPAQDRRLIQPTLGRIAMGVFFGNMLTGVVVAVVLAIANA